ncbi:MAG: DoxX family protein [Acidobacteria bacterium]|nr:DoxX family protein [Acidobacteriota bacterium]
MSVSQVSVAGVPSQRKGWSAALWVAQVALAGLFGMAGTIKATMPIDQLSQTMPWAAEIPAALVRFIGVSELAAAIGLIVPAATRIAPVLTPLAGAGLVLVMVLASLFHVVRGEIEALPFNVVLGALAVFVAWGRLRKAPIDAR